MATPPLNFFTRRRAGSTGKLLVLSAAAIALMSIDNRYAVMGQIKSYAATALYPLQWLANQPVRIYRDSRELARSQTELLIDNKQLAAENIRLQTQAHKSQQLQRELDELRIINHLATQSLQTGTVSEVISNNKDPLANKLLISRGKAGSLQAGDAVIDRSGLLGQITQVYPFSAEVTLLTSDNHIVPVMVARTGVRSLLYGSGDSVEMRYVPADSDLQNGDTLLTSGLDTVYPAGIPVATVVRASKAGNSPYYQAVIRPLAGFRSSKYVLVLPQTPLAHEIGAKGKHE